MRKGSCKKWVGDLTRAWEDLGRPQA